MKNLADAHRLRTHVISCLEAADVTTDAEVKQQLLTFVVAGAGFTGVETVAEVNELIRRALKYYPNIKQDEIRVYLVEYANRILPDLPGGPRRLCDQAHADARHRGQDRRRHQGRDEHRGGADRRHRHSRRAPSSPPSATVPIRSSPRSASTCIGDASRPTAICACRVMIASGPWATPRTFRWSIIRARIRPHYAPQTAQFAVREGRQLANNIIAQADGKPLKPFAYTSKGSLASLGMSKAVAEVYGFKLSGTLAWLLWRGFYLSFLPGFATKLRVVVNWMLNAFVPPNIVLIESSQPAAATSTTARATRCWSPAC